jgi:hypothetical protein
MPGQRRRKLGNSSVRGEATAGTAAARERGVNSMQIKLLQHESFHL